MDELETKLSEKASLKEQRRAIIKIQTFVRAALARKRFKAIVAKRNAAASYLQRVWKRYRMITMVPKAWRAKKFKWISTLQKYIRGFLAFKKVQRELNSLKLREAFDYFDTIKNDLLVDAQIKIRYGWLQKKRRDKNRKKKKKKKKGGSKLSKQPTITSTTTTTKTQNKVTYSNASLGKTAGINVKTIPDPIEETPKVESHHDGEGDTDMNQTLERFSGKSEHSQE